MVANPPWEKLKVERHDFYPALHAEPKADRVSRSASPIAALRAGRAGAIREEIAGYRAEAVLLRERGNYDSTEAATPTSSRRSPSGSCICAGRRCVGCVLPRPLVSGAGSAPLRREYFTRWTIESVDMVWNQRRWVFPGINDRVQSVLLAARSGHQRQGRHSECAPLNDAERFARARELRIEYSLVDLASWSDALELPSLPDAAAGEVFQTMTRHPRFDCDDCSARRASS